MTVPTDLPILFFENQNAWEEWLENNHHSSTGIWIKFHKKDSKMPSMYYPQAVEGALCYGWIDGQARKYDEHSYLQRFTPRRPKSVWSKINTQHIERLQKAGKMKPAGLKAVEEAKKDGRWEQAYDSPTNMKLPTEFLKRLEENKKAKAFFETLNKTNVFAIGYRLQTAKKPETLENRIQKILTMLEKGEKFH
ncbi:YdeI/OmpD-associated family protein [soil metagenome]